MSVSADQERPDAPVEEGVVMELAQDDVARKRFLKMAGKSMGSAAAATALGAFIAACGSSSSSASKSSGKSTSTPASTGSSTGTSTGSSTPSASGDLGIVNYALTLEYLETAFYKDVVKSGLFSSSPLLPTIKMFGAEEAQHVAALKAVAMKLGKPAAEPKTKFPLSSAASVAKLAATVENLGAAAYLGQAPLIKSEEILAAALAIHTVEARHAATLNVALKLDPTPNGAFGKPMTMAQVLPIAKQFIVG